MPRSKKTSAASAPARSTPSPPTSTSTAPGAVLLAIDLQTSLLGMLAPTTRRNLTNRASLALSITQLLGLPIIFTEQAPAKLGPTAPALRRLAPEAPAEPKTTFSALAEPAILTRLRSLKAEHLLLVGLETPVCIYQTALGALVKNLQVTVLSDAVAARRPDDHAACLATLRQSGVHVLPTETVFYALLHDADHPHFRDFTALVKKFA